MKNNARALVTAIFSILTVCFTCGCPGNDSINPARNLQDSEPPHFENLIFPEDGSVLPDGSLFITGTLVDTAEEGESGFDEDCPVYLEIENLGIDASTQSIGDSVLHYTKFHVFNPNADPLDPYFFDFETGNFAIEFGTRRTLKPGNYNVRLIGVDASGNESVPIESIVAAMPLDGIDPQDIYDARSGYGVRLNGLLDSYIINLEQYGELYSPDIQIINELKTYIESTYINSPRMDTWYEQACILHENVSAIPYPDPIVHGVLLMGLAEFKEQIPVMVELKAAPFYPIGASQAEIIDYHNEISEIYSRDIFSVESPFQGDPFSTHYYFLAYNYLSNDQMTEIANFVVRADPNQSLMITGTIGSPASWYEIEPDDYDNPIELLGLFGGSGLVFHLHKFW